MTQQISSINNTDSNLSIRQKLNKLILDKVYFNVKDYGAKGDGKTILDGVMTLSSSTLTSSTAVFTSGDVGKSIRISKVGAAGKEVKGTIATYVSANEVTLSFTASTAATGCQFHFGTDDTVSIQNTINACITAGGGTVFFPNGKYILAGALNTSNNNCQLYFKQANTDDVTPYKRYVIQLIGETSQTNLPIGIPLSFTTPIITNGVQLISIIDGSGTFPSVLSCIQGSGGYGFSYHDVLIKGISIVVPSNFAESGSNISGINGFYFCSLVCDGVSVSIDKGIENSVQPTNECVGILFGKLYADWPNLMKNTSVSGFKYGYFSGEHISYEDAFAMGCVYGFNFTRGIYMNTASHIGAFWCKYVLNFPTTVIFGQTVGRANIMLHSVEAEKTTTGYWFDLANGIEDPDNYAYGVARINNVTWGVGEDNTGFPVNGGLNLVTVPCEKLIPNKYPNSWTTGTRPTAVEGIIGYNTTLHQFEYYNGTTWVQP